MALTLTGHADMWLAVFGDVGVTILAILNAMRCLRSEEPSASAPMPRPDAA